MRIAFVLAGLEAGGAEKIVNLLAHHRLKLGDSVDVLAVNADRPNSYFPYDPSVGISALSEREPMLRGLRSGSQLLALRRRLAAIRPDAVVSFLTKVNVLTGLAAYGLAVPVVMSERNNFTVQTMSPVWRLARPIIARSATLLVMQTEEARQSLSPALRSRAVVIPNPVTLPRGIEHKVGDGRRIVAVGRLEKQKGFDLLIEAFSQVAPVVPAAKLTIFGEGPERGALKEQARALGIEDRVRLPGVTRSPVDWISAGDIFVLSSRFEGFPNVLLEAMRAGLASVAFDCPWGPAEILDSPDAGMLVPAGNVKELAGAIRRLATDSALRQHTARSGTVAVARRYSTPSVLAQWDEVIVAAVTGRPARALAPA